MSAPTISKDTPNAISLPESVDGLTLSGLPDGPMTDLFGQVLAPANLSAPLVKEKRNRMSATYGRTGFGSSASVALQESLESKLRLQLPKDGLMIWPWNWKRKRTPLGRLYFQLALLARSIDETDCGLWPTPMVPNGGRQPKGGAMTMTGQTPDGKKRQVDLNYMVKQTLWPTPNATDGSKGTANQTYARGNPSLTMAAHQTALWATPISRDSRSAKGCQPKPGHQGGDSLIMQISNGSIAPMESHGQLNPEFVFWLMGYPSEWLNCAPQVMPSTRRSLRNSSSQRKEHGDV